MLMQGNKESVHLVGGAASSADNRGFRSVRGGGCLGGGGVLQMFINPVITSLFANQRKC
jgi:hypothetical protein